MSNTPPLKGWDEQVISASGHCHFLQSKVWAQAKGTTAWNAQKQIVNWGVRQMPLVLYTRQATGIGKVHYIPKIAGLGVSDISAFTEAIRKHCQSGFVIKVEFDEVFDESFDKAMKLSDWHSVPAVQYHHTVQINLNQSEEDLLLSFKKRARYEVRSAQKAGVEVERVEVNQQNLELLQKLMSLTSKRANFTIRGAEFNNRYWQAYADAGQGYLYFAKFQGEVLAAAYIIRIGDWAYYKDAGSLRQHANLFASRLMQWEIMRDLRADGVKVYDLGGIPDASGNDGLGIGIRTFKTGFSRETVTQQGAYELPLASLRHKAWKKIEPKLVKLYFAFKKDLWY